MAKNKNRDIKRIKASSSQEPGTDLAEIIEAARDITERRQAEDAFRESESKYRTLFESSTDAIMTLDENSFIDCNTATLKMFGCKQKSEFTMLHPADISPPNQPDGTDSRAAADLRIAEAFKKGSSQFEWVHRTRNGQDFPAEVLLSALKLGGKQVLQATVRDITERRRMEEVLRKQSHDLNERVKEINCLYTISDIADKQNVSLDEMFQRIVDVIPPGWQYPEITCARIGLENQEFKTTNFRVTSWKQTRDIIVHGNRVGAVEVCYLEERPELDEGPFLKDERNLLNAIAGRLGRITERRQGEEARKESEQRFKAIFDNAVDGIVLADPENKKFYTCNKMFSQMLGYSLEEIKNLGIVDIHPEKDLPYVTQQFEKCALKEITLAEDIPVKRNDGSIFYADVNSALITVSSKSYMMGIFRDTTERKKAREELRRLSDAVKMSNDSIVITDVEGKIIEANEATRKMHGMENRADLVGREALEVIAPEDREMAAEQVIKALAAGGLISAEYHCIAKDGRNFLVEASISVMKDGNGEPMGYVAVSRDITERKKAGEALRESEAKLKLYLDNSPDGIYISDVGGNFLYGNREAERITGYPRGELLGKSFLKLSLLPPEHLQKAAQLLELNMAGRPTGPDEFELVRKDGSRVSVEISTYPIGEGAKLEVIGIARDITERKRMEEELRLLSDAVRMTSESIAITDLNGIIVDINEAGLKMYGLDDKADLVGKNPFDIIVPEDQAKALENVARIVETGSLQNIEYHIMTKDRRKSLIETSVSLIRGRKGEPKGIVAVARDITERRRMEEALHESETRYRLLADNVKDVIWTSDLNLRLTYVSPSHTHLTGYSVEEALAQTVDKLMTQASVEVVVKGFAEELALEEKGPGDLFRSRIFEVELNCKDGSTVPVEMKAAFLRGLVGQPVGVLGITRDVRERRKSEEALRESEERFRDLFENANDLMQSIDMEGRFLYVNRKWSEMLGYSKEEVGKLNLMDIIRKDQVAHCMECLEKVASGESLEKIETVFVSKSGREIFVEGNVNAKLEGGKPVSTRGIFRDITERKKAEEAIRELDRMKSEFISDISHELRTPLHSIKGFGKLILDGKVPDPNIQREFLTIIENQSNRLDKLVSNLLDASRLESGRFSIHKQRISIAGTIHETVETLRGVANGKGITIKEDIPATLPEIDVDKERLEQVMFNLLGNAVKFSNDGSEVTVRAEVKEHDLLVQVTDHGIGIPKEAMPRLFQRFYRVEASSSVGGSGLGLYISRQIIEAHGGRIWVESEPGVGSTFSFTLPLGAVSQDGGASHE